MEVGMTSDFLDLYTSNVGVSEVPSQFHQFSGISLVAASVADRVWLVRDSSGTRIYPNLYVFLIGPSGSGKERAIHTAARYVEGMPGVGLMASTGITKQYLIDHFTNKLANTGEMDSNVLYLVTEELSMSIPSKELGNELIKFMTGHYIRSGLSMTEGTRTHGTKTLRDPIINWLAGTTDDWLTQAVEKDAIMGGFFARVLGIRGQRAGSKRCANITYPSTYEETKRQLQARVEMYATMNVQFVKSEEATQFYDAWYENTHDRPDPTDPVMEPAFNRSDEMVHRIATVLKLSSMDDVPGYFTTLEIEQPYFQEAIQMWNSILRDVPETVRRAASTRESTDTDVVSDVIKRMGSVDHSTLLRRARNHGMNAARVKGALETLDQSQEIKLDLEPVARGKTRRVYKWVGKGNG